MLMKAIKSLLCAGLSRVATSGSETALLSMIFYLKNFVIQHACNILPSMQIFSQLE
jgi:hypothetical protein